MIDDTILRLAGIIMMGLYGIVALVVLYLINKD